MGQSVVAHHFGIGIGILLLRIAGWLIGRGIMTDPRVLSTPRSEAIWLVIESIVRIDQTTRFLFLISRSLATAGM